MEGWPWPGAPRASSRQPGPWGAGPGEAGRGLRSHAPGREPRTLPRGAVDLVTPPQPFCSAASPSMDGRLSPQGVRRGRRVPPRAPPQTAPGPRPHAGKGGRGRRRRGDGDKKRERTPPADRRPAPEAPVQAATCSGSPGRHPSGTERGGCSRRPAPPPPPVPACARAGRAAAEGALKDSDSRTHGLSRPQLGSPLPWEGRWWASSPGGVSPAAGETAEDTPRAPPGEP